MIKIIKSSNVTLEAECSCGCIFTYEDTDVYKPKDGGENYTICPECGTDIKLYGIEFDDKDEKNLTVDNIVYPDDFYDFSSGIEISNEQINEWIKKCLKELERDDEDYGTYRYTGTGNTEIAIYKHEDEYKITVSPNFWGTSIPR